MDCQRLAISPAGNERKHSGLSAAAPMLLVGTETDRVRNREIDAARL